MNTRFGRSLFLAGVPLLFSDDPRDNILAASPTRVSLMSNGVSPRKGWVPPKAGLLGENLKKTFPFEDALVRLPRNPVGTQPDTCIMKTKLTLFVTVLAFCFQQSSIGADLKKGLVAYYPFNGNAKDESGNGHHGDPQPGIKLAVDRHGQPYKAYKFSGSHRISITKSDKLALQEHTLSAWVNVLDYGFFSQLAWTQLVQVGDRTLYINFEARPGLSKNPAYGKSQGFGFQTSPKGKFDQSGKGQNSWGGVRSLKDNDGHNLHHYLLFRHMFPYRQWVLLTGTYNGKEMKLYLNGQLEDSVSIEAKLTGSTENWRYHIGPNSTEGFSLTGSIDDVRIYNRGLSAEEVKALYDLEKPKGK